MGTALTVLERLVVERHDATREWDEALAADNLEQIDHCQARVHRLSAEIAQAAEQLITHTTEKAPIDAVAPAPGAKDQNPSKGTIMTIIADAPARVERYTVNNTSIIDRETGRVARFQNPGVAQIGADWLNGPDATPEDYEWVTPAVTTCEAPASGRQPIQTIETVTELAVAAGKLGVTPSKIFPAPWVTLTEFTEYDGNIVHSAKHDVDGVEVTILHSLLTTSDGLEDFGLDAMLKWRSNDIRGDGDDEQFAIYPKDIPALLKALQFVQKVVSA